MSIQEIDPLSTVTPPPKLAVQEPESEEPAKRDEATSTSLTRSSDPIALPEVQESQSAERVSSPLTFPESGYVGVAAKWADLYSRHYESPKEFFYFDLLALIGTALSGRVRADFGSLVTQPRLYVLKIAKSGWRRKSTSTSFAEKFLVATLKQLNVKKDPRAGMDGIGNWIKIIAGAGSGEGIAIALGEHHRVAVVFDELRRFEKKAGIDGSVLVSIANEMFDRNTYANVTKTGKLEVSNGHLGLLSNTTDETFQQLLNASEMVDIGFMNRLVLVPGESRQKVAIPIEPDEAELAPIRKELADYFASLPPLTHDGKATEEILISLTPEAVALWTDWYNNLDEVEETTRLDNIGMRLMGLLAFTSGQKVVDETLMRQILDILNHQRRVREAYQPIQGETPEAKIESRIITQLKQRGPLTKNELRRYTNANRVGTKAFGSAMSSLQQAGHIKIVAVEGKNGKVKILKFTLVPDKE